MHIPYRVRQFWLALFAAPTDQDLKLVQEILSPSLTELFLQMQPGEQAHSLQVLRRLMALGETNPDLLVAALLHDVGKSLYPLHIWDRVLIVIARALIPQQAARWGCGAPTGWKKTFVVAQQHPRWGAELAAKHAASPLAVRLILRHQDPLTSEPVSLEDRLLRQLQSVDDQS